MSKRKWSWRYRVGFYRSFSQDEYRELTKFCIDRFGLDVYGSSWDISSVCRRVSDRSDYAEYCFDRVTVHFKHQDDSVLFKLACPD